MVPLPLALPWPKCRFIWLEAVPSDIVAMRAGPLCVRFAGVNHASNVTRLEAVNAV